MFTNELKKGARVQLRCGWIAEIADNAKGNTRMCKVFGDFTEIGSVYSHDIVYLLGVNDSRVAAIEHTPAQIKLQKTVGALFR